MQQDADLDDEWDEIRWYTREQVAAGYDPLDGIEATVAAVFEMSPEDPRLALLPAVVSEVIETQRREQRGWPAHTDCDRLDRAFGWLEAAGLVCRQDFTCCQTCGAHEMQGEMAAAKAAGRSVRGYVFFHHQDTESAVRGQGLMLGYGPVGPDRTAADYQAIGRMVMGALREAGLTAHWSGSADARIGVELTWQRRRPELG